MQYEKVFVEPLKFITDKMNWLIDKSYGTQRTLEDFCMTTKVKVEQSDENYEILRNNFSTNWKNEYILCLLK